MMSPEMVLKQSMVFGGLDAADLDRLAPLFERRTLHTADVLCDAGHKAQFFFILEAGTLLLAMEEGRSAVLSEAGDLAAMEMLSKKGVYTATVTALTPGAVWVVNREDFLAFIQEDTEGACAVMAAWQVFLDEKAPFAKVLV